MTMPNDDTSPLTKSRGDDARQKSGWSINDLFAIPPPLKAIFDQYPLVTYSANTLPLRSPQNDSSYGQSNILYVFTDLDGAAQGRPSFNPTCLKYQTYLKLQGVKFSTRMGSNHASPSGSLPFLLAAENGAGGEREVVVARKLRKWAANQNQKRREGEMGKDEHDAREEIYESLIDQRIRRAWARYVPKFPFTCNKLI
jgi:hypothetical protein